MAFYGVQVLHGATIPCGHVMRLIPYATRSYTYKNTCHANIHDMTCHNFTLACHVTYKSMFFKTFLICYKKIFLAIAELEAGIVNFCNKK